MRYLDRVVVVSCLLFRLSRFFIFFTLYPFLALTLARSRSVSWCCVHDDAILSLSNLTCRPPCCLSLLTSSRSGLGEWRTFRRW